MYGERERERAGRGEDRQRKEETSLREMLVGSRLQTHRGSLFSLPSQLLTIREGNITLSVSIFFFPFYFSFPVALRNRISHSITTQTAQRVARIRTRLP